MGEVTPMELEHLQKGMTQDQKMTFYNYYSGVKKDRLVALLLSVFIGELGADRFYAGDIGLGVLKLVTFGGCLIWWFIDIFLIMDRIDKHNREEAYRIASAIRSQGSNHLPPGTIDHYGVGPSAGATEYDYGRPEGDPGYPDDNSNRW